MLQYFLWLYTMCIRPAIKWILRHVTGKCELLRITSGHKKGSSRTKAVYRCLDRSKMSQLRRLTSSQGYDLDSSISDVMTLKQIVPEIHTSFSSELRQCLRQLGSYQQLLNLVEAERQIKYSSEDPEHERMLLHLWELLMPGVPLENRISKQWGELGFQGNDPATDFRGMGILGLRNLHYLCEKRSNLALRLLSRSKHPQYGYSLAIVSINLTSLCYELLKSGCLRTHFYNLERAEYTMDDFRDVLCFVLWSFDKFWFEEKPRDVMEFGRIRKKYKLDLKNQLDDDDMKLIIVT